MPQHNHFPYGFEMPYLHYVVQPLFGREDDHHHNARAIFLMELLEKTYINIGAHVYSIIVKETRTTSRPKLVLPSLIMRILHEKYVETL